jgi:hypothetical protein
MQKGFTLFNDQNSSLGHLQNIEDNYGKEDLKAHQSSKNKQERRIHINLFSKLLHKNQELKES